MNSLLTHDFAAFFTPQVEPQRSIANIRLPCAGLPAICALQHPSGGSGNAFEGGGGASSLSGQSDMATLPEDADEVCLVECCAAHAVCCGHMPWHSAFEGGGGASSLSSQSDMATLPEDADEVRARGMKKQNVR
jgi:hypothetical protein